MYEEEQELNKCGTFELSKASNEEEESHLPTTPCNEGATRPCYNEARRELGYAMHKEKTKRRDEERS